MDQRKKLAMQAVCALICSEHEFKKKEEEEKNESESAMWTAKCVCSTGITDVWFKNCQKGQASHF